MTINLNTPLATDAELEAAYNAGLLRKNTLVHGAYYYGICRNATVARWHASIARFIHWRTKFGQTFPEIIAHPEDDRVFDVFRVLIEISLPAEKGIPDDLFDAAAAKYAWRKETAICYWCEEPVTEAERPLAKLNLAGQWNHYECGLRSVIGSVGHQQKRCSCYGGTEEDPPGATRREAARAAAAYFLAEQAARANPAQFLAAIAQAAKGDGE
jgi:hypothetical protein